MNSYFNASDWIVIGLYLFGIIGLGIWFGKDQRNTRDYFLGSRNTPWWGIGLSIVAAETSALTIIGVPALAYGSNIVFIQMIIGYVIARLILAVVMVPHYLKGEIYSPYQLFADRLGGSATPTVSAPAFVMTPCVPSAPLSADVAVVTRPAARVPLGGGGGGRGGRVAAAAGGVASRSRRRGRRACRARDVATAAAA